MANRNLISAKRSKNDEFYTRLQDIENELRHYTEQFRDKVIFCNCDDPYESNFFKYFALNFRHLGLKKLITTSYSATHPTYKVEITTLDDINRDGAIDLEDISLLLEKSKTPLKQNGDFRSEECIELLKEADIVCTNPPFSLFREYIAQLVEYDKKFLVIGNMNAITYKEIFRLIKENNLWLGYGHPKEFLTPENIPQKFGNINWYTNLDVSKRHESITLYKQYNPKEFPHYDNYDAIEVGRVCEIPLGWEGICGVPITFLDRYNPEQFEILGFMNTGEQNEGIRYLDTKHGRPLVNGKEIYFRILIRKKYITM